MCEQCEPRACVCKTAPAREDAMVVLRRGDDGTPTVWCDPCIADIVAALNAGGVSTIASCCGHGEQQGRIGLSDGRELIIASPENGERPHTHTRGIDRGDCPECDAEYGDTDG